jgi:hypothetical protein
MYPVRTAESVANHRDGPAHQRKGYIPSRDGVTHQRERRIISRERRTHQRERLTH